MGGWPGTVGVNPDSLAVGDHLAGAKGDNPLVQSANSIHAMGNRQLCHRQPSPSVSNKTRRTVSRCAQQSSWYSIMGVRFDSERPPMVVLPLSAALRTEATHDDMREAYVKTTPLLNSLLYRSKEVIIQVHALST